MAMMNEQGTARKQPEDLVNNGGDSGNAYHHEIQTSIKHWRMFVAVAECGSFAMAAEALKVSQATISYAIARLEEALGIVLLKLNGRKHTLTDVGTEMLNRSRFLLHEAAALEKLAIVLRQNLRQEVKLAVVQGFPTRLLIPALHKFSCQWSESKIRLVEAPNSEIERMLFARDIDIAINTVVPQGFHGDFFTEMQYVAVARHDHAMFLLDRVLTNEDLNNEIQIIAQMESMANSDSAAKNADAKHWYVSDFETAIAAICEGIGYGWIPLHRIRDSVTLGKLKVLPLQESASYAQNFYLVHGRSSCPSMDVARLRDALHGGIAPTITDE